MSVETLIAVSLKTKCSREVDIAPKMKAYTIRNRVGVRRLTGLRRWKIWHKRSWPELLLNLMVKNCGSWELYTWSSRSNTEGSI